MNLKKKKWQACKPGSVPDSYRGFIIYLAPASLPESCSLPLLTPLCVGNKAGSLAVPQQRQTIRIYMALQPVRRTAPDIAAGTGALLPHLFTRSPTIDTQYRDGYFLLRCYPLSKIFPLRSTAPCVARTFLPPEYSGER